MAIRHPDAIAGAALIVAGGAVAARACSPASVLAQPENISSGLVCS